MQNSTCNSYSLVHSHLLAPLLPTRNFSQRLPKKQKILLLTLCRLQTAKYWFLQDPPSGSFLLFSCCCCYNTQLYTLLLATHHCHCCFYSISILQLYCMLLNMHVSAFCFLSLVILHVQQMPLSFYQQLLAYFSSYNI